MHRIKEVDIFISSTYGNHLFSASIHSEKGDVHGENVENMTSFIAEYLLKLYKIYFSPNLSLKTLPYSNSSTL